MSSSSVDASRPFATSAGTPVVELRTTEEPVSTPKGWARTLRRNWPLVTALTALVPGLQTVGLVGHTPLALAALGAWVLASAGRAVGPRAAANARDQARADLVTAFGVCALVAFATVAGALPAPSARAASVVLLVTAGSTAVLRAFGPRRSGVRRVVLVGGHQDVEAYGATGSSRDVVAGCHVVGAQALAVQPSLLVPTTTSLETLPDLVDGVRADAVLVLPGAGIDADVVRRLTWMFEESRTTVGVVAPVSAVSAHRLRTRVSDGSAILELAVPRARLASRVAKAVVDRVGAALLLLLVAPVLTLMWVAVRLDSRGPGFFVQTRVGRDGVPFRMVKMRTMHRNAEAVLNSLVEDNESDGGVLFKIRRDPRVTRVGYWLRRSSLDELPQLINVLRGDMSLVGPRPALPSEVAMYDDFARRRLVVKPGITGLWQVSGRSDLRWDESLKLDLYYADNWRLVDDLVIAARTLHAVTAARGAY